MFQNRWWCWGEGGIRVITDTGIDINCMSSVSTRARVFLTCMKRFD